MGYPRKLDSPFFFNFGCIDPPCIFHNGIIKYVLLFNMLHHLDEFLTLILGIKKHFFHRIQLKSL